MREEGADVTTMEPSSSSLVGKVKATYLKKGPNDDDPADRPPFEKGRRKIVGGKCWRCGAVLKDIPTDRMSGMWLFTYCTDEDCLAFNTATEALEREGKLIGGGTL